jgi:hypothetical protein
MSPDASTAWTYTFNSLGITMTVRSCHRHSNRNAIGEVRGTRSKCPHLSHFFSCFAGEDGGLGQRNNLDFDTAVLGFA